MVSSFNFLSKVLISRGCRILCARGPDCSQGTNRNSASAVILLVCDFFTEVACGSPIDSARRRDDMLYDLLAEAIEHLVA